MTLKQKLLNYFRKNPNVLLSTSEIYKKFPKIGKISWFVNPGDLALIRLQGNYAFYTYSNSVAKKVYEHLKKRNYSKIPNSIKKKLSVAYYVIYVIENFNSSFDCRTMQEKIYELFKIRFKLGGIESTLYNLIPSIGTKGYMNYGNKKVIKEMQKEFTENKMKYNEKNPFTKFNIYFQRRVR